MDWCDIYHFKIDEMEYAPELLSKEEKVRAAKFAIEARRRDYTKCRVALKQLLSKYASIPISQLRIEYGEKGKPFLLEGPHFNMSHSTGRCSIAIANHPIGIDLEKIELSRDHLNIAQNFFCIEDVERVRADGISEFYKIWCGKEAYAKLKGESVWNYIKTANFPEIFCHTRYIDQYIEILCSAEKLKLTYIHK